MDPPSYDELCLLHFNDVPTVLGRLSHIFRKAKDAPEVDKPITVFSGDAFSPSLESAVLKGEHMVPILNHLLVDVACYGNHDFDFGEDVLIKLSQGCTFPWLLANVVHTDGRLLASAREYLVLKKKGYTVGFFGLAGTDWPSNCQHLPADCIFLDPVPVAKRISKLLRSTHGADLVVVITHMRQEEDVNLAQHCDKDIDMILGGHDHHFAVHGHTYEGRIKLVKSGTDFRNYTAISVHLMRAHGTTIIKNIRVHQTHDVLSADGPEDPGICAVLAGLQARMTNMVDKPLFYTAKPMDGRTSVIRSQETNLGNMLADAVRACYNADIAFINSGSIRCDRIIDPGVVTVKDMIDILPFDNLFVVKRLTGEMITRALENAVCDIIDGRFLQVSGITFCIDPGAPVGERINRLCLKSDHGYDRSMHVPTSGGDSPQVTGLPTVPTRSVHSLVSSVPRLSPIIPTSERLPGPTLFHSERTYTVAMSSFLGDGYDGFTPFRDAPTHVGTEDGVTDTSLFLQLFRWGVEAGSSFGPTMSPIARVYTAVVIGTAPDGLPCVDSLREGRIVYAERS